MVDILMVLGPSGAGKTTFAEYLQTHHRWLYFEIDEYADGGDGIDIYGLRPSWNLFYENRNPSDLAAELRRQAKQRGAQRCVMSFSSCLVLRTDHIAAAEKESIGVAYLYGSAACCINSFLDRERNSGRDLKLDHWLQHNAGSYIEMSRPEFEKYRTHVFNIRGEHRPHAEVLRDIEEKFT
jgi:hypothetical protein